jgi:signal transduction histidine kinase
MACARAELRRFGQFVFEEFVERRWARPEERAQKAAERAEQYSQLRLRRIAHFIRQPLAGLGTEMSHLELLLADPGLAPELQRKFRELKARSDRHLHDISEAVNSILSSEVELRAEEFDLYEVIQEAVDKVKPLADSFDVRLIVPQGSARRLAAPRSAVVEALVNVLQNGVQANRPDGRQPKVVKVAVDSGARQHVITVRDNGTGIPPDVQNELFEGGFSTKGSPGMGLAIAREHLALLRATVALESSNGGGSVFVVTIPATADLRKEQV